MSKVVVSRPDESVPLDARELDRLVPDEPLELAPEDMAEPAPPLPPPPPPPTLEEIARRAAQLVIEIQASAPKVAEDLPAPAPRGVRKVVVRDEHNRIKEVIETPLEG